MNNPGAMLYSDWQKKYGAEPGDSNSAGVFAKFPTVEQGRLAQKALWDSYYKDMPLDEAIRTWTGTKGKPQESENYLKALFAAASITGVEKEIQVAQSSSEKTQIPKGITAAAPQDATKKTGMSDSLLGVTQKTFESDIADAMSQIAAISAMTGQSFGEIGNKITAGFQALLEKQSVAVALQVASAHNSNEIEDYRRPMGA